MFALVTLKFTNERTVIPSKWLIEQKKTCYWPRLRSPEKCLEAIKERRDLSESEERSREIIEIFYHKEYNDYESASNECREKGEKAVPYIPSSPPEQDLNKGEEPTANESRDVSEGKKVVPHIPSTPPKQDLNKGEEPTANESRNVSEGKKVVPHIPSSPPEQDLNKGEEPTATTGQTGELPAEKVKFPLATLSDVLNFPPNCNKETLQQYLPENLPGGVKYVARQLMDSIFTDSVLLDFNWKREGDKHAFNDLNLVNTLIDLAQDKVESSQKNNIKNEIKKQFERKKKKASPRVPEQ